MIKKKLSLLKSGNPVVDWSVLWWNWLFRLNFFRLLKIWFLSIYWTGFDNGSRFVWLDRSIRSDFDKICFSYNNRWFVEHINFVFFLIFFSSSSFSFSFCYLLHVREIFSQSPLSVDFEGYTWILWFKNKSKIWIYRTNCR